MNYRGWFLFCFIKQACADSTASLLDVFLVELVLSDFSELLVVRCDFILQFLVFLSEIVDLTTQSFDLGLLVLLPGVGFFFKSRQLLSEHVHFFAISLGRRVGDRDVSLALFQYSLLISEPFLFFFFQLCKLLFLLFLEVFEIALFRLEFLFLVLESNFLSVEFGHF